MRERPVPHVVQQYCGIKPLAFVLRNVDTFAFERGHGLARKVIGTQGVLKARVLRPGVNHALHSQLAYACQALEHRVLHERYDYAVGQGNEAVHGVDDILHPGVVAL